MAENDRLFRTADARWRRVRKDWVRTRRQYSEEAVHDLRVACRRLIAVLDTLRALSDDDGIVESRRRVKQWLSTLSPLRDLHVQQASIARMLPAHPSLKRFAKHLTRKEERTVRKVQKLLNHDPTLDGALGRAGRRTTRAIERGDIIRVVTRRHREVIRLLKRVDAKDTATIHRVRLAFKRFRYTAEVARHWAATDLSEARMRKLHRFQTMMGEIQDSEVLSARVARWAAREQRVDDVKRALDALERRKQRSVSRFMKSADQVHRFWTR